MKQENGKSNQATGDARPLTSHPPHAQFAPGISYPAEAGRSLPD